MDFWAALGELWTTLTTPASTTAAALATYAASPRPGTVTICTFTPKSMRVSMRITMSLSMCMREEVYEGVFV